MSIFNLTGEENITNDTSEKNPTIGTTGSGSSDHEGTIVNKDISNQNLSEDKKEKAVVVDGPLSHIYTKALNMVYANEGAEIDTNIVFKEAIDEMEGLDENGEPLNDDSLYVFAEDGKNVNGMSDMNQIAGRLRVALDSGKYKEVVLAMECGKVIPRNLDRFEDMVRGMGVKIYHLRESALEGILRRI